ncbi:hypothetical protein ACOALZ_07745 [Nocardiopsis algeriensis]|uniref:hypothetical protein n=1 Tax=Nocardiopsis algeriensis TaxID=1478215 RepID=UPI003B4308F1
MTHPIPAQRTSVDPRPEPALLPWRQPLPGPVCVACDHPSCRRRRAQRLPRLGGHRAEYSREHTQAAALQRQYRHLIVYYGEATQSFWAITPAGLVEGCDIDALLLALWPRIQGSAVRGGFQRQVGGGAGVVAAV